MTNMSPQKKTVTGVILAGGLGRRMGGMDKGWVKLGDRPLIQWTLHALIPQVNTVLINANRNLECYQTLGCKVVTDTLEDFQGPLAGFSATMAVADSDYIVTVPCDTPAIPSDLVSRLSAALDHQHPLAVAHDGQRLQPVFALIPVSLLTDLRAFMQQGGRKIDLWYARHAMVTADFSHCPERFDNINTPQQLTAMQTSTSQTQPKEFEE